MNGNQGIERKKCKMKSMCNCIKKIFIVKESRETGPLPEGGRAAKERILTFMTMIMIITIIIIIIMTAIY